jgi:hypothetical protein
MTTTTVTGIRTGKVLLVLEPNEDREAIPGKLWVRDEESQTAFTIKELLTIPGGDFHPAEDRRTEKVQDRDDFSGIVAANQAHDQRENRRSYYLRTGK